MYSIDKLKLAVSASGCSVMVVRTGDERYKRGFITSKSDCRIGRAVILNDKVTHIKWYCGIDKLMDYLSVNMESIHEQVCIDSFLSDEVEITFNEVAVLIKESLRLHNEDKNKKIAAREKMSQKKRPSIKGRHAHNFFKELLAQLIQSKKEKINETA